MKKIRESSDGAIMLEISIVLPMFILVVMYVYGLFVVNIAENEITHALVQSTKSLSLDSYTNERYTSVLNGDEFWSGFSDMMTDVLRSFNDQYYSSSTKWYDSQDVNTVKNRFIGFFSGGDENKANEKLIRLGIKDGVSGLNFTVTSSKEEVTVKVSYTIQIWFDAFGLGKIPMEHQITSKMWS